MPIVSRTEFERRQAARLEQQRATEQVRSETAAPASPNVQPVNAVPDPEPSLAGEQAAVPTSPAKSKKAGQPRKQPRPKKQPTGDYENGYCRAPFKNRFDGSRPGPGRPRGALSQDTLLKKHLSETHSVARGGKQTKAQTREVIIMMKVKAALSGDRRAQDALLAEAARLFAERRDAAEPSFEPANMDEHDQALLEALRDTMFPQPQQDNEAGSGGANDAHGAKRAGGRP